MAKDKSKQSPEVQELLDKISALENESLNLLEENDRLRKQLEDKQIVNSATVQAVDVKVEPADLPTFSLEGKTYRFRVHVFRADGAKHISALVAADPVQCALILEKYPSLVQEV